VLIRRRIVKVALLEELHVRDAGRTFLTYKFNTLNTL